MKNSLTDRFLKILDRIPSRDTDTCWTWPGAIDRYGYGSIRRDSTKGVNGAVRAHRVSYEHFIGPIPDGLAIDHLCRNRACVNPTHLEPVTPAVNARRGREARTHCKNGHAWTDRNTGWQVRDLKGRTYRIRVCLACRKANGARHRARQMAS